MLSWVGYENKIVMFIVAPVVCGTTMLGHHMYLF